MDSNKELIEALNQIEKEKDISKDILLEAIENSLLAACKNQYGKSDNIKVTINRDTGAFAVYAEKEVVAEVEDPVLQISLEEAAQKFPKKKYEIGDVVNIEVTPKNFGRIAAQKAKQVVVQKIREEERKVLYHQYFEKERDIVTGIVQRYVGENVSINLGKVDAVLTKNEQIAGEHFRPTERIKLYVVEVKDTTKGPKITVSRTHPELVKRLFEAEVTEVRDGIVEIRSISREAGARTKMAVSSNDPNVDPVGACVGVNGARVNAIVDELRGEKIDIINWSDDPALLIQNALSPAKVVSVTVDEEEKTARVVVPGYQLSLAIGREGQNARLAARLTGYKIDIKSDENGDGYYDYQDGRGNDKDYGEEGYPDERDGRDYDEDDYQDERDDDRDYDEDDYPDERDDDRDYGEDDYQDERDDDRDYGEDDYKDERDDDQDYDEDDYQDERDDDQDDDDWDDRDGDDRDR